MRLFTMSKYGAVLGAVFYGIGNAQDGYRSGMEQGRWEGKRDMELVSCGIREALHQGFNGAVGGGIAGALLFAPLLI